MSVAARTPVNGLERLVFFSDGVYAIAATLLAIDVRAPMTDERFTLAHLTALTPSIAVYALTFVVIGLFWVSHHRMFDMIARMDYALVWLNMLVLMFVAFLPVPNRIFAHYWSSPYAVLFYAVTVALAATANAILWRYASHNRRHIHEGVSTQAIRSIYRRHLTTLGVQLAAMALAFTSTMVAASLMIAYALVSVAIVIMETRPRHERAHTAT